MENLEIVWGNTHMQYTHIHTHICMHVCTYTDILVLPTYCSFSSTS